MIPIAGSGHLIGPFRKNWADSFLYPGIYLHRIPPMPISMGVKQKNTAITSRLSVHPLGVYSMDQNELTCFHKAACLQPIQVDSTRQSGRVKHCLMKSRLHLPFHQGGNLLPERVEDGESNV